MSERKWAELQHFVTHKFMFVKQKEEQTRKLSEGSREKLTVEAKLPAGKICLLLSLMCIFRRCYDDKLHHCSCSKSIVRFRS